MAETSDSEWEAHPAKKRRDGVHASERGLGGRQILRCYPAAQVGSLGNTKKSTKLAEGRLGESLREEVSDVHIRRNITYAK